MAASYQLQTGDDIHIKVIPSSVVLRPEQRTAKPLVKGVQTAIVVGPSGEEIHTDEHGRVKVQFHWDRYGQKNEHSSCWLRVAQPWAGANWGGQFIPRIGAEVLVGFLGGDVDQPVVLGSLYNGARPYPFALPEEAAHSGFRSQTTPEELERSIPVRVMAAHRGLIDIAG